MKKFFFRQAISRKQSASLQIQEIGDDDDDRLSSRSSSIVSIDLDLVPLNVIDHFDGIYSHQSHKRCINSTYLTLLLLTFSVVKNRSLKITDRLFATVFLFFNIQQSFVFVCHH